MSNIVRHFGYVDLGEKNFTCQHYGELFWAYESLKGSFVINPKFGMCCLHGKVRLTLLPPPP